MTGQTPKSETTTFEPPTCPNPSCPAARGEARFRYQRRGRYLRACDGRVARRFSCCVCGKWFSDQSFRATYRQKRPELNEAVFRHLVAKTTHRQTARALRCNRKAVQRRIGLLGRISRAVHAHLAPQRDPAAFLEGGFLFDELETYATSRRNNPLTVPVLIHRDSFYVVHTEVGPLPRRGGKGRDEAPPAPLTDAEAAARSAGSKRAVRACVAALARLVPAKGTVHVGTDEKATYHGVLWAAFGERLAHGTTNSRERRDSLNPLFRINLTLAMLRDGVSRLVRETWAASKQATWLREHLWAWIAYRNYVRGQTNQARHVTPAQAIGAATRQLSEGELLEWGPAFVPHLLCA